jgi:CDP-diacylglycerol--glycerol-3-phosphate 3-phosphatidyltransferase
MRQFNQFLDAVRAVVRSLARRLAHGLDWASGGKLTPAMITLLSLAGHVPIAWLIATNRFMWAAALLVVFGLMDTLDGELARLQTRANSAGMLLDASTDRMKEALLYTASAYVFVSLDRPYMAAWAVAACGGSMLVSYIKAKGETAVFTKSTDHHTINYLFADGLMRYEIRMFVFLMGLLSGRLILAVIILAVLTWLTALNRLLKITQYLKNV